MLCKGKAEFEELVKVLLYDILCTPEETELQHMDISNNSVYYLPHVCLSGEPILDVTCVPVFPAVKGTLLILATPVHLIE